MSSLTPSFRLPVAIPKDAAHPQVIQAVKNAEQGINDLNQANVAMASRVSALEAGTTSTATSGGTTAVTTATENVTTVVVSGGSVNNQSGNTAYTTSQNDNGALVILSSASPVAVTLNFGVTTPWYAFFLNQGTGNVTLTPQQGLIDGAATLTLLDGYFTVVFFDGSNFWAANIPIVPLSLAKIAHEWLDSYDATTGLFTQSQPAFADVSGNLATSQLPTTGLSVTVTTAKLTTGGTQGSMVYTNGLLTSQVQAT